MATPAERTRLWRQRHPDRVKRYSMSERAREGQRRRNREYEARNPGRSGKRNAKFRATPKGCATYLFWNAQRRARVEGVEFALTREWIEERVNAGHCEVTGLPFMFGTGRKPWAASLDRLDPNGGYTPDNVRAVVWLYNAAKAEFTHDDVLTLCKALLENTKCAS